MASRSPCYMRSQRISSSSSQTSCEVSAPKASVQATEHGYRQTRFKGGEQHATAGRSSQMARQVPRRASRSNSTTCPLRFATVLDGGTSDD